MEIDVEPEVLDMDVLFKILHSRDPNQLKEWKIPGFETMSVESPPAKRIFKFSSEEMTYEKGIYVFVLRSPSGERAVRFTIHIPAKTEGRLNLRYKVDIRLGTCA